MISAERLIECKDKFFLVSYTKLDSFQGLISFCAINCVKGPFFYKAEIGEPNFQYRYVIILNWPLEPSGTVRPSINQSFCSRKKETVCS